MCTDISTEENKILKEALVDPEFRKLFHDYLHEIQDPKNRVENENYIKQLEKEMKVPEGKRIIHPKSEFVIKVKKVVQGSKQQSEKEKLFINIVSSNVIQEPKKQLEDKCIERKSGSNWSLAHSIGPLHMETDSSGENVPTFDCCVHPQAIQLSSSSSQFKDFLIHTAMDGVQAAYREMNQVVTLENA